MRTFCHPVCAFLALTFLYGTASPQNNPEAPAPPPDSLRLHITFPGQEDTVTTERVRFSGRALPKARVRFAGKRVRVYPTGAFVGLTDLAPGWNQLAFTARDPYGTLNDTVRVFRVLPAVVLPERPTAVDYASVEPRHDVFVSPGDLLEVRFRASPGGEASFSLDKVGKHLKMVELSGSGKESDRGLYTGSVVMPDVEKFKPRQIEFQFRGRDGRRLKFKSPARVHLLSPVLPLIGVTADSSNLLRTEPDGEIWMELPKFVKMRIVGKRDGVTKVQLAENVVAYIDSGSLRELPLGTPFPHAYVRSMSTVQNGDWLQLRVNISERVPFRVEQLVESQALEVTFFRARPTSQWISYPPDNETVRWIRWRQETSERFVLRVDLNQKQPWGYAARYVGRQFWLDIRRTPHLSTDPDSLLKGLTVVLDPGHGGEYEGAVSPTGLFEKHVNLDLARSVAAYLREAGARVVLTRDQDSTVTLQERVRIALETDAHLFVSLHHNSIGPATNPLRPRGTSTFFTLPQSEAVARAVFQRLVKAGLKPFGRVVSTFYVTRQTRFLSFLVETLFMTHPEDEMLLLDAHASERMARAVAEGIKDFARSQGAGTARARTDAQARPPTPSPPRSPGNKP